MVVFLVNYVLWETFLDFGWQDISGESFTINPLCSPFSPSPRTANTIFLILAPDIATCISKSQAAAFIHGGKCVRHGFEKEYEAYLLSVQSLSRVWLFATPWTAARQASLSITNSWSLLKLMSIESVMPSSHLIFCCPLLLLPPIPPSIRVFSNESALCIRWPKY